MKKYLSRLFPAILFLSMAAPEAATAAGIPQSDKLVIRADTLTYEKADDTYRAMGNVYLEWDGAKLVADKAFLNQGENVAEAEGKAVLTSDGDILRGDKMTLHLDTGTGEVTNGDLFKKIGNFHLRGGKMEKVGPESYHVDKGSFTVCDGAVPSWKFNASEIDVMLGEYATAKNLLFYIRDVPVLYLPFMIFPVKRERQSGFLLPQIGSSSLGGFTVTIPYYWAISPSQDATFDLDIQSKRGVGTGVDYRYIGKSGTAGSFRGYLIYDTEKSKLRGSLSEKHQQAFSPSLYFKSDINYVSDKDFFRDYTEGFAAYNQRYTDSYVFLTKHWQRYLLTPELRFSQDLSAPSNTATLQKLPVLTFTGVEQRIGTSPFYYSLDSNFTNFYRETGVHGQRIDMHPTLLAYSNTVAGLEGTIWGGYRHRLYNMYGGTSSESLDDKGLFDGGARISSTLSRVYDSGWKNMPKLQHTMVPEVSYTYVQNGNQDELPFFDFNDRVVHENKITYSIANYLTGKFAKGDAPAVYRDVAYLKLSQEYDFSGTRRDLLTSYDELHRFNDLRIEAQINPVEHFSLAADTRINPYRANLSTADISGNYNDGGGNTAGVSYHYARNQYKYLEARMSVALVNPFVFNFAGRYSIDGGKFLESLYSLEYKHQCWSVILSYGDRPGNQQFYVNFVIAGIGSLGKIRAF